MAAHPEAMPFPVAPAATPAHTNGAFAASLQLPDMVHAILSGKMEEQFRPYVKHVVHETLGKMFEEEVRDALSGISAPIFVLPQSYTSHRTTNAMKQCRVDGCKRAVRSKGLCSAHYQKERRDELKTAKMKASKRRGKK